MIFKKVNIESGKGSICFGRYLARLWSSRALYSFVTPYDHSGSVFAGGGSTMSGSGTLNCWHSLIRITPLRL